MTQYQETFFNVYFVMEFSNYKSVNTKLNAVLEILKSQSNIHLSQDFRRTWRLTTSQLELIERPGFIKLQKTNQAFTVNSGSSYTYITKGPNFNNYSSKEIKNVGHYIKCKNEHGEEEYIRRKLLPYIDEKILMSLVTSCNWYDGDTVSMLNKVTYSHITGRIYYPYNKMKKVDRKIIENWKFKTIDANGSQLVLLANELERLYPGNSFSNIVLNAEDVYEALKTHVDERGYKKWLKKLEHGTDEEYEIFKKLNETFFDQEFDGQNIPRQAVKLMMYRIIFGGQADLLSGFNELKTHVDAVQGKYIHLISCRYRFSNKAGYNYLKNIASIMSHQEAKVMRTIALEFSKNNIKYQLIHDAFDIEESKIDLAKEIINNVVTLLGLKNYKFSVKA